MTIALTDRLTRPPHPKHPSKGPQSDPTQTKLGYFYPRHGRQPALTMDLAVPIPALPHTIRVILYAEADAIFVHVNLVESR